MNYRFWDDILTILAGSVLSFVIFYSAYVNGDVISPIGTLIVMTIFGGASLLGISYIINELFKLFSS